MGIMIRASSLIALLLVLAACGDGEPDAGSAQAPEPDPAAARRTLALAEQELEVAGLLLALAAEHRPADADLVDVRVVDPAAETVGEPACVRVREGRIAALVAECPPEPGVARVDGGGAFLTPGLADMHVHQLESAAIPLLNVAHGVTTVRDMDGFPWLLEWRRQAAAGEMFAPSMFVTGRILNAVSYGWYTRVVETPEEVRRAVREQAADGYDAIKIHNVLPMPLFDAAATEARAVGLDLVGHIPHGIPVAHAVASGMWTFEHFKGYIDDRTLQISDEDWLAATRGAAAWHCPTLYAERMWLRGAAMEAWFASPEARWVPELRRRQWREDNGEPVEEPHRGLGERKRRVLTDLLTVTDRFLAGTDSGGGYPFMVPGAALHAELAALQDAGLTPPAALRAATTNAAAGLRREGEMGAVVPGARADLLLVAENPLDDVAKLRAIEGVVLRGAWLDRAALDDMLERLASIQARVPAVAREGALDQAWVDAFLADVDALRRAGYVFPSHHLRDAATALATLGYGEAAERLRPAA